MDFIYLFILYKPQLVDFFFSLDRFDVLKIKAVLLNILSFYFYKLTHV